MGLPLPKQFLILNGKPIAQHSLDVFASMPEIIEIVVVCAPEYHHLFDLSSVQAKLSFALPGNRRQDSVFNGLQELSLNPTLVSVHDTARPLITATLVHRIADAAEKYGAATAALPVKFTVRESDDFGLVVRTPNRSSMWEIQTPQIVRLSLLREGFANAHVKGLNVTDDVSLVELMGLPVQLIEGCHRNLKITTPEDLVIAQALCGRAL
ncbi:MAG: 2-C-methyl-D-erythritol 4-phosphate cytidylyltransferase [Parachlamydiaceae bacterium]|nr:2-C-methyl-D-erythritol 4-phosphate cytidylyltransferase [Parachlamydiaceae bacterium]